MRLTSENYFHPEMQLHYMSCSQFKSFHRCEAAALAELRGQFERPVTPALLVGSYVDAYFEGSLPTFLADHPEILRRDDGLKSDYVQAETLIRRLEQDKLFTMLMAGRKQVIKTGEIAGVPFKIKIDSYLDAAQCAAIVEAYPKTAEVFGFCDGAIVDLKCVKDLSDVWSPEDRLSLPFVAYWGYDTQGAIYQAVEGNLLPFILAVGTKEKETNLAALTVREGDLAECLAEVTRLAPRYQAIKQGEVDALPCGVCAYCRRQKTLTDIVDYREACLC